MTEVLFYHLQNMTLENVLPPLLEKSLERGWRVVVQATSEERADALDAHLWTYRDDSFLPHATWRVGDAHDQPIVLAVEEGNPNKANVRFLIDNALQCLAEYHIDGMRYDEVTVIDNNGGGDGTMDTIRGLFTQGFGIGEVLEQGEPSSHAAGVAAGYWQRAGLTSARRSHADGCAAQTRPGPRAKLRTSGPHARPSRAGLPGTARRGGRPPFA